MGRESVVSDKVRLVTALIALQFCFAGFHIVSRVALNIGVSKVVYPVYRNSIALLVLGPFAYFLEKKDRPPLTFSLLLQFFFLALIGITANQGFYLLGLYYATPTFASAMQNSVPAITFIMASITGLEQVSFVRRDGLAKVLGTLVSIGGATIITLYKGIPIFHLKFDGAKPTPEVTGLEATQNWTWGCIYLLGHCLSWAGWMVLQAPVLQRYPAKLSITSFTCLFGLIQFLGIAFFVETDIDNWIIQSREELFTILYAMGALYQGMVASGVVIYLQTWCIYKGGPVFVAVFQPLQTLLVAIMACLCLGDDLYSGRIIGAVLIMLGLYFVLWGKATERNFTTTQEGALTKQFLDSENSNSETECAV